MKKNILVYGLIAGVVVSTFMLISMNYYSHCEGSVDYETSMLIGYASMLVAFSLVFVGIRNYRDKFNQGAITFGKAVGMGLLMVLIASTLYVICWEIRFYFFDPDFMVRYTAQMIEDLKASGAPQAEIDEQTQKMAEITTKYNQLGFNAMMTYMEILPAGVLVTLISSLILRKKPASAAA